MEVDEEGTIEGVSQDLFTRGQFDVCPESFLNPGDFPKRSSTFVREAYRKTKIHGIHSVQLQNRLLKQQEQMFQG